VQPPSSALNPNILFYLDAASDVTGRNIIKDGVCEELYLTLGAASSKNLSLFQWPKKTVPRLSVSAMVRSQPAILK